MWLSLYWKLLTSFIIIICFRHAIICNYSLEKFILVAFVFVLSYVKFRIVGLETKADNLRLGLLEFMINVPSIPPKLHVCVRQLCSGGQRCLSINTNGDMLN